jgi:large subunit ribosomal protein L29
MKVQDIRALSPVERDQKLVDLKHELFNMRFQKGAGQLENSGKIKQMKRDIARIKTVTTEAARNPKEKKN